MAYFGPVAGPQGPAGSPYVPDAILVYDEGDLPAPVLGVITLAAQTVYRIMAPIMLTAGRRIELPVNSALVAELPAFGYIQGDVNDALVTVVGAIAEHPRIMGVGLLNLSTSVTSAALRINAALAEMLVFAAQLLSWGRTIDVVACESLSVLESHVHAFDAGSRAIGVEGPIALLSVVGSHLQVLGAGSIVLDVEAAGAIGSLSVQRLIFVFSDLTQRGIKLSAGGSVGSAHLVEVIRSGIAAPMNDGWDQGTPEWHTLDYATLPDSVAAGTSYVSAGGFTVTLGNNVYAPVAPAVGTPWALSAAPASERFSLDSANTGRLIYDGVVAARVLVSASATLSKAGATRAGTVAIALNGALVPGSEATSDVSTRSSSRATAPVTLALAPGDTIELWVKNDEAAEDFVCALGSLSVIAAVVS